VKRREEISDEVLVLQTITNGKQRDKDKYP
jgi:hypothetical protein